MPIVMVVWGSKTLPKNIYVYIYTYILFSGVWIRIGTNLFWGAVKEL